MSIFFKKPIVLFLFTPLLTACATLTSGFNQKLTLRAMDNQTHHLIKNADCTITSEDEREYRLITPETVNIRRGQGKLTVTCTKPGYKPGKETIAESINPNFDTGISNSITSFGWIVDALTGAVYNYPHQVTILMIRGHHGK